MPCGSLAPFCYDLHLRMLHFFIAHPVVPQNTLDRQPSDLHIPRLASQVVVAVLLDNFIAATAREDQIVAKNELKEATLANIDTGGLESLLGNQSPTTPVADQHLAPSLSHLSINNHACTPCTTERVGALF
jgi:hypothetical protein